ncbi:hypothetical protein AN958_04842 [Leucoagaricus sp. SymC.cos]|nr:hypothetical protein AN958_04842 [Leucoagaricus sp. SymC.cos]
MDFVEDLIPVILESNDHWWGRDFTRLALVSRGWLYHIRKRLYASPCLYSFAACASLARTLESNPDLTSLVQKLALRPTCASSSCGTFKDRIAVRRLLGLEGLRSLTLGGELAIQSERFLGFVTAVDNLERLHIDGASRHRSMSSRASLEWSEDLRFRFPNLKSLRLSDLELDINPSSTSQPVQWDELILENVSIVSGFLSHLAQEGSTLGKLRVKASSSCEYNEHIQMMLHSSDVLSLEYEVQKASSSDGAFLEHEEMTAPHVLCLRHLELRGLLVDTGLLNSVRHRCPEIEELVVSGRLIFLSPKDWGAYLTSGALPSLRCLRLTGGTNHPPYQPWDADAGNLLAQAALQRRIEFGLL